MKYSIMLLFTFASLLLFGSCQLNCQAGEIGVRFLQGQIIIYNCIKIADQLLHCGAYDFNDLTVPYTCSYCLNNYDLITFVQTNTNACLNPIRTNVGCNVYWNPTTLSKCFGCQTGFNVAPYGTYSGLTLVFCTYLDLIKGDGGVTQSKCLRYDSSIFYKLINLGCSSCQKLKDGSTTLAKDCSAYCKGSSNKYHVTALNSAGVKTQGCYSAAAPLNDECALYAKDKFNCLQCSEGYSLVHSSVFFFGTITKCIPSTEVIPGCWGYFYLNYNFCYSCQSTTSNPLVDQNFYYQYQVCADSPANIIANCTQFANNNKSFICSQCQFKYWLDTQNNRCVQFIFHCQQYSNSSGICLRCIPRYYLLNQVCTEVAPQCLTYDQFTGVCKTCIQGYIPSPIQLGKCIINTGCPSYQYFDGSSCKPGNIANCLSYQVGGQICITCDSGYQVSFIGACKKTPVSIVCLNPPVGFKYVIKFQVCVPVPIQCVSYRDDGYCFDCGVNALAKQGLCHPQ